MTTTAERNRTEVAALVAQAQRVAKAPRIAGTARPARTAPTPAATRRPAAPPSPPGPTAATAVDAAVRRARAARLALRSTTLDQRAAAIAAVREAGVATAADIARLGHDETGLGRYDDKVVMARTAALKTPGTELLVPAYSGSGLSVSRQRPAAYGVIASVLPMTVPNEAVVSHTIAMVSGGNAVVFMAHPSAARTTGATVEMCSRALAGAGLPADAVTLVEASGSEAAVELMRHPDIDLLVVTGGGGVVAEAMKVPVKAICAGPGNTPVIIDETADPSAAAACVYLGSSFDNTIGCVQEKEVFVPHAAAKDFVTAMGSAGAHIATPTEIDALTDLLLTDPRPRTGSPVNRDFIGRDASVILDAIGSPGAAGDPRSVVAVVEPNHPFIWSEMLLPVLAVCPTASADDALEKALEAEHGNRHSSVIHSRDPRFLAACEQALDVNVLVRNSPSFASVGVGSAQPFTVTLASRTGEGPTTARDFVRHHHVIDSISNGWAGDPA
ncbi:aldehyde dehydrogenase family protein [Gordonia sp. X0973]|uniref:aldehyde dehydrogenase family protein n=1 Tax=Gordonia sp. X0973 TaxID=2742602 RepID=UPI00101C596F|nr:aldehyde dehydrogenase family protein [Gordonia sp. X0973]QKT08256.1 aldehyde dehydrogenase family protein [Gordonia sp. X0973]